MSNITQLIRNYIDTGDSNALQAKLGYVPEIVDNCIIIRQDTDSGLFMQFYDCECNKTFTVSIDNDGDHTILDEVIGYKEF